MRIIIGYDGSEYAHAAMEDLPRAGLGDEVEARVMTIADSYPHLPDSCYDRVDAAELQQMQPMVRRAYELAAKAMAEARQTAEQGTHRLAGLFPTWKIQPLGCAGTPMMSLIGEANTWGADLIVVGSQGRGALSRALLGSVSQGVVTHANCSVRVGRRRPEAAGADAPPGAGAAGATAASDAATPPRIILGIDGSPHAAAALNAVSLRKWPAGTEVRIVVAVDIRLTTMLPTMAHEFSWPAAMDMGSQDWPVHAAAAAAKELKGSGLRATPAVQEGDAKRVLVEEADNWPADCIFLGARGLSRMEGLLLGSVSASVAARAHCSVEVVRFE